MNIDSAVDPTSVSTQNVAPSQALEVARARRQRARARRPLACPLYKHDPSRYGGPRGCADWCTFEIHRLFSDHLKTHVRRGHISQKRLDGLKQLQADVTPRTHQQRIKSRWDVAYLRLHDLANGHAVPSPYYERRDTKSQQDPSQDQTEETKTPRATTDEREPEIPSSSFEMAWETFNETPSSEVALFTNPFSPSSFDFDPWLRPLDPWLRPLTPFPSCSPPARNKTPDTPTSALPPTPPNNGSLKICLVKAQRTCQCLTHSTYCQKYARLVPRADLICACCCLPFAWSPDPVTHLDPVMEAVFLLGVRSILMATFGEHLEVNHPATEMERTWKRIQRWYALLEESEKQGILVTDSKLVETS